jgi:glycine betaine/proline transport system permease protein
VEHWITDNKIPLGRTMKELIDALQAHSRLFDSIKGAISFLVDGLTQILLLVPPLLLIAMVAALAYWLHRSLKLAAFIVIAFLLILNLG